MIDELLQQVLDRLDHRYFGKYRGYVHRVDDPWGTGRIQAMVPRLLGDSPTGWALPCAPFAGPDQGVHMIPEIGAGVWIEFEGGDLSQPIWTGGWWGAPTPDDVDTRDATARVHRRTPEVPHHDHPEQAADPRVRMIKSASGHHIVLDDRPGQERVEIHDRFGNRMIFTEDGVEHLVSNERTVNEGARNTVIDQGDELSVGGNSRAEITGTDTRIVHRSARIEIGGDLTEAARSGSYSRVFNHEGMHERVGGPRRDEIRGGYTREVTGAIKDTAGSGYGLSAGGPVNIAAGGSLNLAATTPDLPSLNAVDINAFLGNISINTKLGVMQLGGMTAVSPLVVGDGLLMHLTLLVQILKTINPLTVQAYGPALDVWLSMAPMTDLSFFAYVKRLPIG